LFCPRPPDRALDFVLRGFALLLDFALGFALLLDFTLRGFALLLVFARGFALLLVFVLRVFFAITPPIGYGIAPYHHPPILIVYFLNTAPFFLCCRPCANKRAAVYKKIGASRKRGKTPICCRR
jgi:hypothetical protein